MLQSCFSLPLRPCFCNSGEKGPWCPRLRLGWGKCVSEVACDRSPVPCRASCPLTASPREWACSWARCWVPAGFVQRSSHTVLSAPELCVVRTLLLDVRCPDQQYPCCLVRNGKSWAPLELPTSVCILTRCPGDLWACKSLRSAL